ncbi:glucose transport transcription regulator RGT1 [Chaetomidium leptoderma]|uniref:Glucose transport transcription regulator RGT1 n=1 Tax=Chaetomidium leptoderma TaxID=669021 RepID=A0AAN6ZW42_9PEZI|nr:glucose transport transcription regulator RGT1 [Chaetomidium leptoderma]
MDDKKPAPEAEDAVMHQSYPSPIVDSTEAQYYQQLAQHRELEPQMDLQPAQPDHHGLPNMPEHQEQHHEHHELHQLQGLHESPAPQQQTSRPPVSADELQLAAQLTQGLAPMMGSDVQDQAQEQQSMPQQDGQEGQVQAQAEPNLQEQLEASLQDHERELQSHEHEHELQNQDHELQNHELQGVMPHAGQAHAHHYAQNPPPAPHLPHHMSMEHMPQASIHPQYQLPDATPPRKRSKVSRACDECRRKKIKCDAQSDANEQPCSNCRRSNAQCLFSRVPQKRGPSKGYIKELADRINTIEGKLNTNVDGLERRDSSEAFASPGLGDESRKRPFSSISGEGFQTPSPNRLPMYPTDHRPILPYLQPDFRAQNSGDPADLSIKPATPMQFPGPTNDMNLQGQPEMMDGISQNGLPQGSSHQADQLPEIEDEAFNRYLEVVHPTFPVLASTKARVQSLLWQSPLALQNAFYNAFFSMVKPFLSDPGSEVDGDPATTCRLLSDWEAERKPGSPVTDLVRLQTLVMALISIDCHGIASAKGQLGGASKTDILGRAVGLGYSMKIHLRSIDSDPNPELDPNSDDNVALRAWWVLVMLDRWNAVGLGMPTLISNDNVVVPPGLEHIAGEVVFMLIRISFVLGHLVPLALRPPLDPFSQGGAVLDSVASVPTQMLAWVFPAGRTDPVLHLAYWHVRLLSELISGDRMQRTRNILQAAKSIVGILACNYDLLNPITHHFATLLSLGLLELRRFDETRDEAVKLINDVLSYSMLPTPWNASVRDKLAEIQEAGARPGTATSSGVGGPSTSQNLQQLADLATAVDGSAAAPAEEDGPAKEEPLVAVSNGTGPAAAAADGKLEEENHDGGGGGGGGGDAQQTLADVRTLLKNGYLTCFDEPKDEMVV